MDCCWESNFSVEERFGLGYVCCSLCSGLSVFCVPGLAFCNNDRFKRIVLDTKATVWVNSFLSPLGPSDLGTRRFNVRKFYTLLTAFL